ncbi:hypothetical protein CASFOL_041220 [Castilleja foliolosa]|uniref:F-box domain-containing protein n=1 Tax=Castilleja foliolosa TaxID=1961234 RepID=A0ABD3BEF4_9LAMI
MKVSKNKLSKPTKGVMENTLINSEMTFPVTNISSLPDDIMFQILVRLPAQDIYDNARLVCPSWYKIIRTHNFARAHLVQATHGLLIQDRSSEYDQKVFVSSQKDQIGISNINHDRKVLSSCNGLVLDYLYHNRRELYVSNPVTKRRFALPPLLATNGIVAMAYVASTNEYKAVRTIPPYAILTVGVDKDWTRLLNVQHLSKTAKYLLLVYPLTTEGFVHWARDKNVLTLNVETEIFTLYHAPHPIPPPLRCYGGETLLSYLPMGSYLSMLIGDQTTLSWEVWIMKPETGEWRKMTSIDIEAEKCTFEGVSGLYCRLRPVGWLKLEEVLVFNVRKEYNFDQSGYTRFYIAYNDCTSEIETFELDGRKLNCDIAHTNSLIWLDGVPFVDESNGSVR